MDTASALEALTLAAHTLAAVSAWVVWFVIGGIAAAHADPFVQGNKLGMLATVGRLGRS
jgi:hypothetical protein